LLDSKIMHLKSGSLAKGLQKKPGFQTFMVVGQAGEPVCNKQIVHVHSYHSLVVQKKNKREKPVKNQALVYAALPKTGLGNLLLVWSRAKLFSHLNQMPLVTIGWSGIRWGAWLRGEKKKRMYWDYFQETPFIMKWKACLLKQVVQVVRDPVIERITTNSQPAIFLFTQPAVQDDLFGDFREHRQFLRTEIYRLLKPALCSQLHAVHTPEISVHIRRGDFTISNPLTPIRFFVEAINFIRSAAGKSLSVTVFTDAGEREIKDVLALPNTRMAEKKADILDILQMSKSRVIVLSRSSTFSYWAAFLSEAIIIKPFEDWQEDLRPADVNRRSFEGKICFSKPATLEPLAAAIQKEKW
jgi:hypothetical protein